MTFTLSDNIKVGQKIKTNHGWRKVLEVSSAGILVKEGFIKFGSTIYGWKNK